MQWSKMSKKEHGFLSIIGEKLGLENATIIKAQEYYRLCCVKSNLDRINDIPKGVLCLDLAAKHNGVAFDKETALKLSTLSTSSLYEKNYNFIEKSLQLNEVLNIPKLCVKLNCSEVKELAEMIIYKYKSLNVMHDDFNHPQYNAIAVYTACRLKNIKVTKKQFIQESQLRQSQWKQLESKFLDFAKQIGLDSEAKQSQRTWSYEDTSSDDKISTEDSNNKITQEKDVCEEVEDYEIWKERILKEAYAAMKVK